jgi:hypothetical protein
MKNDTTKREKVWNLEDLTIYQSSCNGRIHRSQYMIAEEYDTKSILKE